jgi:DNA-binding NarL/FixJ family response regulator
MSLIAVRAETAPYRLSDLPESVRAEFGSLSDIAREALTEMRRLLGVLRHDEPPGLAPQPQLSDLPTLVDTARQAGVSVELSVPRALDQVPSGVALCAYRIVQEPLSNASQHAPGAAVTVSVNHDADAVLLRVANGPGGSATREILRAAPSPDRPRVLMLTTFDLDDYVYQALRAGASGFLLKDATSAELIHGVRVVAAGDALLAPSVTRRLIADFARQPRSDPPFPTATLAALTHRESEVLRLIARGMSNAEISDALVIAEQTTKTHIGRILAKLNLRDRAQAVVLAYETGLVTPGGSGVREP